MALKERQPRRQRVRDKVPPGMASREIVESGEPAMRQDASANAASSSRSCEAAKHANKKAAASCLYALGVHKLA